MELIQHQERWNFSFRLESDRKRDLVSRSWWYVFRNEPSLRGAFESCSPELCRFQTSKNKSQTYCRLWICTPLWARFPIPTANTSCFVLRWHNFIQMKSTESTSTRILALFIWKVLYYDLEVLFLWRKFSVLTTRLRISIFYANFSISLHKNSGFSPFW